MRSRFTTKTLAVLSAMTLPLLVIPGQAASTDDGPGKNAHETLILAKDNYMYAGGRIVKIEGSTTMTGQSYVRVMIPQKQSRPFPVVMIHGARQNGTSFTGTPDGRDGWAQPFLRAGYTVYVVDWPGMGKSPWASDFYGTPRRITPAMVERRFTAPKNFGLDIESGLCTGWPQAALHTQWPGRGLLGDPIFERYFASQTPGPQKAQGLLRDAMIALLDEIGPAIVMTHSTSSRAGWAILDARPDLVKAHLAVEPNGPPFFDAPCPWAFFPGESLHLPWGLSTLPLTYEPAVSEPSELASVQEVEAQGPDLARCWKQKEPARQLVKIRDVPTLIITAEASYHAGYDHCTVQYLEQAGVDVDWIRLEDMEIFGNGHMLMLELNNSGVAKVMIDWANENVGGGATWR